MKKVLLPTQVYKPKDFGREVEKIRSFCKEVWFYDKKKYQDEEGNLFEFDFQDGLISTECSSAGRKWMAFGFRSAAVVVQPEKLKSGIVRSVFQRKSLSGVIEKEQRRKYVYKETDKERSQAAYRRQRLLE